MNAREGICTTTAVILSCEPVSIYVKQAFFCLTNTPFFFFHPSSSGVETKQLNTEKFKNEHHFW